MKEIQKALSQAYEIIRHLDAGEPAKGLNSFLREKEFSEYGQWEWEPPAPDNDDPDLTTSTGIMWAWEEPEEEGKPDSSGMRARIFIPWPQEPKNGGFYTIEVRP